jgi:arylsulfatase A-like enzyme
MMAVLFGMHHALHAAERPHVILVMADDQGWGDAGYNGHPYVQTPAMDAMAKEAFVFDRFYAAAPVCSPTRASVMTGRHPIRSNTMSWGSYMRPNEQTLGETLKAHGYVTGLFGKVHLGSGQPDSPCNPSAMGFDEWVIGLNFFDNDPYLSRKGVVEHREGKGSVIVMDEALAFIEKHRHGTNPLFTVIWFPSPHLPHAEAPDGLELYTNQSNAGYYREITLLDQQLGRLRRDLRRMNLADNTILWYCSDNGGLNAKTSGGRGKKKSIYEGGLRVPGILEYPAARLKGRTSVPVSTSDIYPTLMSMLGIELDPAHPPLDGVDVSKIISGEQASRETPIGFWFGPGKGEATHSDTILKAMLEKQEAGAPRPHDPHRMKKHVDDFTPIENAINQGHAAWNDWPWKLHRINGKKIELYNLEQDPMETNDVSGDVDQQERVITMRAELETWMQSVLRSQSGKDYADQ